MQTTRKIHLFKPHQVRVLKTSAFYTPYAAKLLRCQVYRYSFNGMEADPELKGNGNSYTTEFRQYDPRLGRWFSVDPKANTQPYQSAYCSMDNNPIWHNDQYVNKVGCKKGRQLEKEEQKLKKEEEKINNLLTEKTSSIIWKTGEIHF